MWIPKLVVVPPKRNHTNRLVCAVGRIPSGPAFREIQAMAVQMASTNEAATARTPTSLPWLGNFFPSSRMTTKLRLGSSGMSHAWVRNQFTRLSPS